MSGEPVTKSGVTTGRGEIGGETVSTWRGRDGQAIACREKLKVLNENLEEMRSICQDALDDAVALGCDPESFRAIVGAMLARLESTLRGGKG